MSAYERPSDLAFVEETVDPQVLRVYLTALPDGPLVVLEGAGALIWRAAQQDGDVVATVAQATGEPEEAIAETVTRFVDELLAAGVLERSP